MGKSWGARMALETGLSQDVAAIAAVVPAISAEAARELLPSISSKLAFCFAKDQGYASEHFHMTRRTKSLQPESKPGASRTCL
eukprot:1869672-Amphidinium_carterae.1